MIKTLKILVVSALTLACLYVALEFFLGFSGYGRYRPENIRRYPAPAVVDHAGETDEESHQDEKTEAPDHPMEKGPQKLDSKDS